MNHSQFVEHLGILLVEDDQDIAENIADYFEAKGHRMDFALNGIQGLHLALTQPYDVMILDIMLPGMDGKTLCSRLRDSPARHLPVLMLTARDTLDDKLSGFDAGADDYLVKPFALQELEARVHALSNRARQSRETVLFLADLMMDTQAMTVTRAGRSIHLNRACMCILELLMRNSPKVVLRQTLEQALWGDMPPGSDALRSHMYMLRQKIDKPFTTTLIQTVHGVGYKLVPDPKPHKKNEI
nr:response regulator transcription factor [uncultured Desulfobacter sp.]